MSVLEDAKVAGLKILAALMPPSERRKAKRRRTRGWRGLLAAAAAHAAVSVVVFVETRAHSMQLTPVAPFCPATALAPQWNGHVTGTQSFAGRANGPCYYKHPSTRPVGQSSPLS